MMIDLHPAALLLAFLVAWLLCGSGMFFSLQCRNALPFVFCLLVLWLVIVLMFVEGVLMILRGIGL